jgi:hypothetical protein
MQLNGDISMKVLIVDVGGRRYWGMNGWTSRAEEAVDFKTSSEALEFSVERGVRSGTMLMTDGKPEWDIRIPLGPEETISASPVK